MVYLTSSSLSITDAYIGDEIINETCIDFWEFDQFGGTSSQGSPYQVQKGDSFFITLCICRNRGRVSITIETEYLLLQQQFKCSSLLFSVFIESCVLLCDVIKFIILHCLDFYNWSNLSLMMAVFIALSSSILHTQVTTIVFISFGGRFLSVVNES